MACHWIKHSYGLVCVAGNEYPEDFHALPPQIIIGAQYVKQPALLGLKKNGSDEVAFHITGDGGAPQGDFYEGVQLFWSFQSPSNLYRTDNGCDFCTAGPVRRLRRLLAQKQLLLVFQVCKLTVWMPLAVYEVTKKRGHGPPLVMAPVLIGTLTYRYGPHTLSGDDPTRYRSKETDEVMAKARSVNSNAELPD